jgi:hypothetical protein
LFYVTPFRRRPDIEEKGTRTVTKGETADRRDRRETERVSVRTKKNENKNKNEK